MNLRWLAALGCLAVLATAHPVTDSTETLVITKVDVSTEPEVTSTTELATEEPVLPIKLTEMEVTSEVSLRYAHTAVVARFKNPAKRAQEANFRVLLPETAFISGFIMTLDGKSYKAYVKEKEEAKQIYDQAVSQGLGAAHVAVKARDSNQFVVSVNVEASTTAVFNLTYEELLVRRDGTYQDVINLHPGTLVPKLSVTVHIKESEKITELRVPEIRTGNEIDATKDDPQNSKAVIVRGHDDREATITFTPDLDEQKRLMDIYAQKSRESVSNTHRWYSSQDEEDKTKNEGALGQFVVQYDVDRTKEGEILVNDGYFVHFFAPASLPPLNKYVVFVLDTSGSMMDRKIIQLREAMQTILSDLNPGDFFSIVEFASSVTVHSLKEADQEPSPRQYYYNDYRPTALVAPSLATPENVAKAKVIVSRLDAAGGTNINSALDTAVTLVQKRYEWCKTPEAASDPSVNATTTERTTTEASHGEVCDVERMKSLEPIIIFLTDGDPTVGETNPTTIINRITEKNYGENKATIFSLAFGEDADRNFLRKLSLRCDGFMRHIYEAADAALQLQSFYRQVSSPLLADVKFVYSGNQVKEDSLTKNKFKTFYAGSEMVVAGKLAENATEISAEVQGFCGVQDGVGKKRYEKRPLVPVPTRKQGYLPLERLWSYLTIKQLLDEKDASDKPESDEADSPKKKALALALKYEFVTPLTSLVVVKPNATKAVDAESVDKPNVPTFAQAFGTPLSINSASSYPSSGFAYASVGLPGMPAPPSFASQALSDFVEEEAEDYDFAAHEEDSGGLGHGLAYSGASHSYPKITRRIIARRRRPIVLRQQLTALNDTSSRSDSYSALSRYGSKYSSPSSSSATSYFYPVTKSLARRRPASPSAHWSSGSRSRTKSRMDIQLPTSALPPDSAPIKFLHAPSFDVSYDDDIDGMDNMAGPSTPLTTTPPPRPPTTAPPAEAYHLDQFTWVAPLLNTTIDALVLQVKGTEIVLKLTKDGAAPKAVSGDAACPTAAATAGAGLCVYLTRCTSARALSVAQYADIHCTVDGYAGVCCSAADVDKPAA